MDSTNRTLAYNYSGGHLVSIEDPLARFWYFTYGTAGGTSSNNLWYVTLPTLNDGNTYDIYFGYDGNSNIIAQQTPQGHIIGVTSTFGYDTNSPPRLIWMKDPIGNKTTFTYNTSAGTTTITDPNGYTTTHTYNISRLASVTDALNFSASTTYDYNNIPSKTVDKRGNPSAFSSHFSNNSSTSTSTDAMNYITTSTVDAKNKVVQSVDGVGNTTANTYTGTAEDLSSTSVTGTGAAPFKATSKVGGYTNGLPTTFTDPLGHGSSAGYDGNGYPNSVTDANGITSTAIYNVLGWKLSSTDANGNKTTYTPDNWGRITVVTAPDKTTTTTTYDADGKVKTFTDANSHTVTNLYDADDRLTQTQNGRGDVIKCTYDGPNGYGSADRNGQTQYGLLSSKTDGNGHTTYYTYTARNEPYQTIYPDGNGESVWYDANGNVNKRQKSDLSYINYAYDADNRLTDITYTHLHATHFDYDADGRKTHMSDATGDTYWYFTYDGLHENQQTTPQGTVYFTSDGDGRRYQRSINTPSTGQTSAWAWTYDYGGRLTSLQSPTDGTTTYTYDGVGGRGTKDAAGLTQWGLLSTKTKGSGDYELYDYDNCNELTSIGYWFYGGTMQNALTYTYDLAGNVKTVNQGYYATTYGYDGANQLVSETSVGGYNASGPPAVGYTYDHNGNRLTQTSNGTQVQSFGYDAHDKLVSGTAGNEVPGYDANGSETSISIYGGTYHLVYDDEDRMTSLTTPGGTTDTFVYNGLGMRVGKTDSTGTYSYVCDGTSPGSDVLSDGHALYTPGLSENRGGASSYYSNDRLGNLWTLDGTAKNQLTYINFTGFGTPLSGGLGTTPFGYGGGNGCQTDNDCGLVLMGHRYYDTRIGRFITQDPAGSGNNWYEYAGNDPVDETDPMGLVAQLQGSLNVPGTWTTEDITNFLSDNYQDGEYKVTNGTGSYNITINNAFSASFMQGGMGLNMGNPGMGGAMFAASRKDRKTIRDLAEQAGYELDRITDHEYWSKPGSKDIKLPNENKNDEKHVVDGLKRRLNQEIQNAIQADINMSRPSATETFWASRTDYQLAAGSLAAAGIIVGSFFIPGVPAAAASAVAVAP